MKTKVLIVGVCVLIVLYLAIDFYVQSISLYRGQAFVMVDQTPFREGRDAFSDVIDYLDSDDTVQVILGMGGWWFVHHEGRKGYIFHVYLSPYNRHYLLKQQDRDYNPIFLERRWVGRVNNKSVSLTFKQIGHLIQVEIREGKSDPVKRYLGSITYSDRSMVWVSYGDALGDKAQEVYQGGLSVDQKTLEGKYQKGHYAASFSFKTHPGY